MLNVNTIKALKLVAILSMAVAFFLTHLPASVAQDRPTRLFEIVSMFTPFEERVGIDDGAAFVVHFAGDTRGALDTCG